MGAKSNKYDYSNRSRSGPEVGRTLAQHFEKDAEKALQEAGKLLTKARKASSSGADNTAPEDVEPVIHRLNVVISGKQLSDEGVVTMAQGLERALKRGTSAASLVLEDLNLSGNCMTTASLRWLARIIVAAQLDLQTLILSNNNISVHTPEQMDEWQEFLDAFKNCKRLRCLDLSGNCNLGERAFEMLCMIHTLETPVHATPPHGDLSVHSLDEIHRIVFNEHSSDTDLADTLKSVDKMSAAKLLKRRTGLRSFPFIKLTNTGLDDAGALWLSFVLEDHHYPSQLIDPLNAVGAKSAVPAYQQDAEVRGIDWGDNDTTLGKDGAFLLSKVEALRLKKFCNDRNSIDMDGQDGDESPSSSIRAYKDALTPSNPPRAAHGFRRASIKSLSAVSDLSADSFEVDSARKRIQRSMIAQDHAARVYVWRAGLRIVILSRLLFSVALPYKAGTFDKSSSYGTGAPHDKAAFVRQDSHLTPIKSTAQSGSSPLTGGLGSPSEYSDLVKTPRLGYQETATLAIVESNDGHLDDESQNSALSLNEESHKPDGVDVEHLGAKFASTFTLSTTLGREKYDRYQKKRQSLLQNNHGIISGNVVRLPQDVVKRIISHTLTKRAIDALAPSQWAKAMTWGGTDHTLERECGWRKLPDSSQILTLLDNIDCLTYRTG